MKHGALLAWALFAAAFCIRLDVRGRPLTGDNQFYFYMAERAASGIPPHISLVDSKNDLGTFVGATSIRAGRAVGIDDVIATRIVSVTFFAVSVALAAELAAVVLGAEAAGHVAALSLLAVRGLVDHAAAGNNVKVFLVGFLLLAHLAVARGTARAKGWTTRTDLVAGLAAGAAFAVWQPGLIVVAAVVLEALVSKSGGWSRALVVAVASTVPFAACEAWMLAHGALTEQWGQAYVRTLGSLHAVRPLVPSLSFVLREAVAASGPLRLVPCASAVAVPLVLLAALWSPRWALALLRRSPGLASLVLAATASTAFTLYDHQGVPDLFFPDPYFALATAAVAIALARFVARSGLLAPRAATASVAGLAMLALAAQMHWDESRRQPPPYGLAAQRELADVTRAYHEEFGAVWVYGAVHLLGLAHLDNHVPLALFCDDVLTVVSLDTYLPLKDGRMPEIIVHARGALPGGSRFLLSQYVEITSPAFAAQSVMVWRRVAAQPRGLSAGDWRSLGQRPKTAPPAPLPKNGPGREKPSQPPQQGPARRVVPAGLARVSRSVAEGP